MLRAVKVSTEGHWRYDRVVPGGNCSNAAQQSLVDGAVASRQEHLTHRRDSDEQRTDIRVSLNCSICVLAVCSSLALCVIEVKLKLGLWFFSYSKKTNLNCHRVSV